MCSPFLSWPSNHHRTFNVQDFGASSREYVYGHLDSGLVGMFAVMVGNGQGRKLLAASKSEPFGLNGDCGCAGVQPTRLGRDLYGWILKYGDVAQGVVSSASSVFAPLDGRFSLIAVMPDIEEDRQRVSHRITFDDSNPQAEHYPLILTALMDGREIDRRRIEYDKARDRYPEVPAP